MKKINYDKLNNFFFIFFISVIFLQFLFYKHFPIHDEVSSVALFTSFKTAFLLLDGHNHFLTTLLGNVVIFIFNFELMYVRLTSLISFLLSLFLIQKYFNDYIKTFLFLLFYLSVDIIITYNSLFRGYAISFLIYCFVFFSLNKKNYLENIKLVYFILSITTFHNVSTLYINIPILLVITFELIDIKKNNNLNLLKIPLVYFVLPFSILTLFFSLLNGVYIEKIFINFENLSKEVLYIINNFFDILHKGFKGIFFNEYNNVRLSNSIDSFIYEIKKNILFFSIFIFAFLKSTYFIFFKKKYNLTDKIVLIFFIFFFLLDRNGPIRIYTGFVSFFIIYILKDLSFLYCNEKIFKKNLINITIIIVILFQLINIKFVKIDSLEKQYLYLEEKLINCNFPSQGVFGEFEKKFIYYIYLEKCKAKPDINSFYKFYKA